MYAVTGDKTGAMQQYNVLKTLNPISLRIY
jgi:hypothetical protein